MALVTRPVSRSIKAYPKQSLRSGQSNSLFVRSNGEPVNKIGWTSRSALKEITLGIGPYIPLFFAAGFFDIGAYIQEHDHGLCESVG